jgi:hypothetical protein
MYLFIEVSFLSLWKAPASTMRCPAKQVARSLCAIYLLEGEHVQGVNDTRNVTKDSQQDVDQEISSTATLEEHTHGWEKDSKDNFADVAARRLAMLEIFVRER